MRIPLEILRAILEHVQDTTNRVELLRLRLVNSIFDGEILSLLFTDSEQLPHIPSPFHDEDTLSHRYWRWVNYNERVRSGALDFRFINSDKWTSVPASLQKKYLRFRLLRVGGDQQSLFAGLFTGVRELVSSMGVVVPGGEGDLTEVLLPLCAFEKRMAWVAGHHAGNLFKVLGHLHGVGCTRRDRDAHQVKDEDEDPRFMTWSTEISIGYNYVLACLPISNNDSTALLKVLHAHPEIDILATALPFGTSILGFAIQNGSPELLANLLSSHPLAKQHSRSGSTIASAPHSGPLERHSPFDLLCLATQRPTTSSPNDIQPILSLLYTEFAKIRILSRKSRPEKLLAKAIWRDVPPLVDFLIEKVEEGEWVGVLKGRMEEVLEVGGFGEPRGYRMGIRGVRLGTGWEKWEGRVWERRRGGMVRSLGVLRGRFG